MWENFSRSLLIFSNLQFSAHAHGVVRLLHREHLSAHLKKHPGNILFMQFLVIVNNLHFHNVLNLGISRISNVQQFAFIFLEDDAEICVQMHMLSCRDRKYVTSCWHSHVKILFEFNILLLSINRPSPMPTCGNLHKELTVEL
jgi:hypothetical protein